MKNLSTWLLVFFMIMFWGFRVIVAVTSQLALEFGGFTPLNFTAEVLLAFAVLVCIVLVIKRHILGGLLYLLFHGMYFGADILNTVMKMMEAEEGFVMNYANTLASAVGIILAIAVLLDMAVDKGRKLNPKDKKTDWFYTNKDFDRELDERADKNNYRTM